MKTTHAYERFVRPLLFSVNPETAHHLALNALSVASSTSLALGALQHFRVPSKARTVFGVTFPNPVGLAAGFDKNGVALPAWAALGFGFAEIGTVTAKPQSGNSRPRIFRYPEQKALINRLGFNNEGADAVATRLRKLRHSGLWPQIPIGINIGKSKITPIEEAADDYRYSFRLLNEFADYIVLNVSSPNTPGLRSLQEGGALASLLGAIRNENQKSRKPLVVKIAPDLSPVDLDQIIEVCEANDVAALIATNTTLDHALIPRSLDQSGGLSGAPLREKSTDFVRAISARSRLPVIASGGVFDAQSACEKIEAGASLVQIYTGYVYRGPGLVAEIVNALA
jgi:dihydroorotate dehydrogenase